jgi:hypothetical protein
MMHDGQRLQREASRQKPRRGNAAYRWDVISGTYVTDKPDQLDSS